MAAVEYSGGGGGKKKASSGPGVLGPSKPSWMPKWMYQGLTKQNQQINAERRVNQAQTRGQMMKPIKPASVADVRRVDKQNTLQRQGGAIGAGTPPAPLPPWMQIERGFNESMKEAKKDLSLVPGQVQRAAGTYGQDIKNLFVAPTTPANAQRILKETTTSPKPAKPTISYEGVNSRNENAKSLMTMDEYYRRNNARLDVSNPYSRNYNPKSPFYQKSLEQHYRAMYAAAAEGKSMYDYQRKNTRPAGYWEAYQDETTRRQNATDDFSNPFSRGYNPTSPYYSPALEQWYRDAYAAAGRGESMYNWQFQNYKPRQWAWVPFGTGYVKLKDTGPIPPPNNGGGGGGAWGGWGNYGGGGYGNYEDIARWFEGMTNWNINRPQGA